MELKRLYEKIVIYLQFMMKIKYQLKSCSTRRNIKSSAKKGHKKPSAKGEKIIFVYEPFSSSPDLAALFV
jgi:hypothetical protein